MTVPSTPISTRAGRIFYPRGGLVSLSIRAFGLFKLTSNRPEVAVFRALPSPPRAIAGAPSRPIRYPENLTTDRLCSGKSRLSACPPRLPAADPARNDIVFQKRPQNRSLAVSDAATVPTTIPAPQAAARGCPAAGPARPGCARGSPDWGHPQVAPHPVCFRPMASSSRLLSRVDEIVAHPAIDLERAEISSPSSQSSSAH